MTPDRDDFERRLADQMAEIADTPLPGRRSTDAVALLASRSQRRPWWTLAMAATVVVGAAVAVFVVGPRVGSGGLPDGALIAVPTAAPRDPSNGPAVVCDMALLEGTLVADAEWGIAVGNATEHWPVLWPNGYYGRVAGTEIELLDGEGRVLGRTGDHIEGGGGAVTVDSVEGFGICPVGIEITPANKTSPIPTSASPIEPTPTRQPTIDPTSGSPAAFRRDPDDVLHPTDTSFVALVHEISCSGNRPIDDKLLTPVIDYGADAIVVRLYLEPLGDGAHTCPGNEETRFVIELDEPIGDRAILDGTPPPGGQPDY